MKRHFKIFASLAIALFMAAGVQVSAGHAVTADSREGKKIVALDNVPLVALDGTVRHVQEFQGKVLVLNQWAYWCPNCIAEMASLQKLQDKYGAGKLTVILVSMPENWEKDKAYAKSHGITLPLYVIPASVPENMRRDAFGDQGVLTLPQTTTYDKDNMPRNMFFGGRDWNGKDVEAEINQYPH